MTIESDEGGSTLAPDDAFAVLGNETRMGILQTLAEATEPLTFSELRDRVGMRDSGQFNYHLDQLTDHFVRDTDEGYTLQRASERVIEAVLSGAVTEAPVLDRTEVGEACPLCGASTEVRYRQERVEIYCPECEGTRGSDSATIEDWVSPPETGLISYLHLPPAGVHDRSPENLLKAGFIWSLMEIATILRGVCPKCSATLDHSVTVCENHEPSGGRCDRCDQQFGVTFQNSCSNCIYELRAPSYPYLWVNPNVMKFIIDHGYDPLASLEGQKRTAIDEEILSTEPFKARFIFTLDDDTLTLTVDDNLNVIDATKGTTSETV